MLDRNRDTLVADLMRRDWMLNLGRRQAWDTFDAVHADWVVRDESGPRCLALQSRVSRGENVAVPARALLMQPRDLGEPCNNLLAALAGNGQFGPEELRQRLEVAIESGSPSAMRRAALLVNPSIDTRQVDIAIARPSTALASNPPREVAMIAFGVLARTEPAVAAERLDQHGNRLRADDRSFLLTQVAASAMRKLMPEAHAWTLAARDSAASDETLAWMARAALRAEDWPLVKSVIGRMSPEGRADPAWTYWLGRALQKEAAAPARGAALRRLEFAKADVEGLDASATATDASPDANVSDDTAADRRDADSAGTEAAMQARRPGTDPPSIGAAPHDPGQAGAPPAALPGIAPSNSAQHQARVLFTSISGRPISTDSSPAKSWAC